MREILNYCDCVGMSCRSAAKHLILSLKKKNNCLMLTFNSVFSFSSKARRVVKENMVFNLSVTGRTNLNKEETTDNKFKTQCRIIRISLI